MLAIYRLSKTRVSKMICLTFFLNICIIMMYSLEYTYWLVQSKHPCRFIRGCFFCPKKQIKGGDIWNIIFLFICQRKEL